MPSRALTLALVLLVALPLLDPPPAWAAEERGRLTGGIRYTLPDWFKQSFLELADDAAEAAEADKHVMLFIHADECPYCADLLHQSIAGSDYTPWLQKRFDVIAINVRGDREVVFDAKTTVTEKELAQLLKVRQTPTVVFLDGQNRQVMRSNGYKTPKEFKRILDYVDSKSYLSMDLPAFVAKSAGGAHYALRPHPAFKPLDDLSGIVGPLMVIFEDGWCDACDLLHDTLLADPEVNELLGRYTVVRLDTASTAPLVDPAGRRTSAQAWSRELELNARPMILLFDDGREVVRIEGVLRHFHFVSALRFVAEEKFLEFPTLSAYGRDRAEQLLKAGVDVDLGRQ